MTLQTLHDQIRMGEDSSRQFKADVRNAESLAAEMVAFSNSAGGTLYIGVADDGTMPGLSAPDVARINQLISNAASQFHADELPTKAGVDKLDKLRFRDFLRDVYKQALPDAPADLMQLLQNMNLATDDGNLNLAGVLMFAERPEWIAPQFVVKAIRYPGNQIHPSTYIDTEDFAGPFPKIFSDAQAFIMRNLHKTQAGRGVNAPGQAEISESVFEELLVNALVHRDYLVSAPIRLFIFDDRIEIISPGHLPNNLTVEKIRAGNSNIRNPILVSYVAKGLLPYHGLGSGIKRALSLWPEIEFTDDRDGCLFTATVRRIGVSEGVNPLFSDIAQNPGLRTPALAKTLNTSVKNIERWLQQLKAQGLVEFRGAPKTGGYHATVSSAAAPQQEGTP